MNSFNKEDRKHIQNVLDNLVVKKEDLSKDELSFFKEMDEIMAKNPNFKNLSPNDLIDAFGLEESDKKEIHRQLDEMVSNAEKEMKQVNLTHILPGVEESVNDILLGIKNGIAANPAMKGEVEEWMKSVRAKVGDNVEKMETLSDEEFARDILPPAHLRQELKNYMPQSNRISDINLDASQDPRDAFVIKKK